MNRESSIVDGIVYVVVGVCDFVVRPSSRKVGDRFLVFARRSFIFSSGKSCTPSRSSSPSTAAQSGSTSWHRLSSRWTRTRTSVSWKAKLARATTNLPVRQHSRFLVDQICVVGNVGQRRVADENADANNDDDNEDQGAANARANVPVALRHLLVRVAVVLCLISLCHARVNIAEK
jgi:hypothetical protein